MRSKLATQLDVPLQNASIIKSAPKHLNGIEWRVSWQRVFLDSIENVTVSLSRMSADRLGAHHHHQRSWESKTSEMQFDSMEIDKRVVYVTGIRLDVIMWYIGEVGAGFIRSLDLEKKCGTK